VEDIDFEVDFVGENSNKIAQKLCLEGKNQLSPQCVHIGKLKELQS
jgi:hypothetical protein